MPASVRFKAYRGAGGEVLPARPHASSRPSRPRCATPARAKRIFHAVVRKNYGITSLIVGRDHAGVGKYYEPLAAQRIFDQFTAEEIGVTPLKLDPTFYCRACGTLASSKSCPHDASTRLDLSGTKVRETLRAGGRLPEEFTRPRSPRSFARTTWRRAARSSRRSAPAPAAPAGNRGFVLWFTGLSGAGKSTLAEALTGTAAGLAAAWRCSTATRSARTSRRGSASRRKTATSTSAASASWRGCSRATASSRSARPSRPTRMSATSCGRWRRRMEWTSSRCTRDATIDAARGARRQGPLSQGAGGRAGELHRRLGSVRAAEQPRGGDPQRSGDRSTRACRGSSACSPRVAWWTAPCWRACRRRLPSRHEHRAVPDVPQARPAAPCSSWAAGRVAASKLASLLAAGAEVTVVAPDVVAEIETVGRAHRASRDSRRAISTAPGSSSRPRRLK